MASDRRIAIRLGTEGKAQVVADLDAIGAAGDASAGRLKRAYERDTGDAEAALQRLARTQEKIGAILPQSALQMRVDERAGTGFGEYEGSAKRSATAFRELIAAEEALDARAKALIATLSPAAAAQDRFNKEAAEAKTLLDAGRLSSEQYSAAIERAQVALENATGATRRDKEAAEALATMQARVTAAGDNGFGGWRGSAERSAGAFRELIAEEEKLEARTKAFTAALYPAVAAQQRFDQEIGNARDLVSRGAISLDQYCDKLRLEQRELNAVAGAGGRANAAAGAQKAGLQQLGFQLNDTVTSLASGSKATTVFAQQSGQFIQAIQLMSGGTSAFATFMGGPWGIALTVGLIALGPLVSKLLEESEASKEAKKAADEHRKAVLELADAQGKAIQTAERKQALDVAEIRLQLDAAAATRVRTQALLEQARANLQSAQRRIEEGGGDEAAGAGARFEGQVADLDRQLAANAAQIAKLQRGVDLGFARMIAQRAEAASTPEGRIKERYERLISQASSDLAGVANGPKLRAKLDELIAARDRELKAIQQSASARNQEYGRSVTSAQARSIAERAGLQVNGGGRTYGRQAQLYNAWVAAGRPTDNPVARPGTSAHEFGNALDIQKTAGATVESIKAAFAAEGVRLTKIISERGHWHVEWARGREEVDAFNQAAQDARDHAVQVKSLMEDATRLAHDAMSDWRPARVTLFDNPGDNELTWSIDQQHRAQAELDAARDEVLAREEERREQGIRTAASLYRDLMTGGVNSIWQRFESYGLDVLSNLLAKWTIGGQGGSGGILGALGSIFGGLGSKTGEAAKSVGHNAAGSQYWSGGTTWLAENGPELVNLPAGSRVTPAAETRRMLGANDNARAETHNHWHLEGAVVTQDLLDQMNAIGAGAAVRGAAGGAAISDAQGSARRARKLGRFG